jgi:hypothetical protein
MQQFSINSLRSLKSRLESSNHIQLSNVSVEIHPFIIYHLMFQRPDLSNRAQDVANNNAVTLAGLIQVVYIYHMVMARSI